MSRHLYDAAARHSPLPAVYFAGPIDYVEHRSDGEHLADNWRHRYFGKLPIRILCPTCLNRESTTWQEVMDMNIEAQAMARFMVAYFPGDVPTFGTPIEVWQWQYGAGREGSGILVHPTPEGVFVRSLRAQGLIVVKSFEEAVTWLRQVAT